MKCGSDAHGGNEQDGCGKNFTWSSAPPYQARIESREMPTITAEEVRCRGHNTLHPFVDCCVCGSNGKGIVGPRFRCIHCKSFDVCINCEKHLAELHEPGHVFEVLLESDFCWSTVPLPLRTKVHVVRSGDSLPHSLPPHTTDQSLEGCCGKVTWSSWAEASSTEAPVDYQWQSDSGSWHTFDAHINVALGENARAGQRITSFIVNGTKFNVDLQRRVQINMETRKARMVRTVPQAAETEGEHVHAKYWLELDGGSTVLLSAVHLAPVLTCRQEAEELIERSQQVDLAALSDGNEAPSEEDD